MSLRSIPILAALLLFQLCGCVTASRPSDPAVNELERRHDEEMLRTGGGAAAVAACSEPPPPTRASDCRTNAIYEPPLFIPQSLWRGLDVLGRCLPRSGSWLFKSEGVERR